FFFFSSRRRHTRFSRDWSSDVCSSDLQSLKEMLLQVSQEFKMGNGEREILTVIDLKDDFECDINRISQLYSNLLANAINHGASDKPVNTKVIAENGVFSLSVSNSGDKIPEEKIATLLTTC